MAIAETWQIGDVEMFPAVATELPCQGSEVGGSSVSSRSRAISAQSSITRWLAVAETARR
jgi:hypothetical protein